MKQTACCLILAAGTLFSSQTWIRVIAAEKQIKSQMTLEPAVLFNTRDGLPNVAAKLKTGQAINVVFLGGSITVGGSSSKGYITFLTEWFKTHYPTVSAHVINSGISGTGSDFGARRYERDVLAYDPDLVLIEFCVNDGNSDQTVAMERMIHKTWLKNPKTDIVIFYTLATSHLPFYKDGNLPPSASAHERVAAFYGIPTLGTAFNAASKINANEIPWSAFSNDGCHPKQEGYILFNNVFAKALPELLKASPAQAHALNKSITANLVVCPPPVVTKPLDTSIEFVTAKGEKAQKVYPLPIPNIHWTEDPLYRNKEGKTLWRLSWVPSRLCKETNPSVGIDKTLWETNDMVWFAGDQCFTGPNGQSLFVPKVRTPLLAVSVQTRESFDSLRQNPDDMLLR